MPVLEPTTVANQFPGYPRETLPDLTGFEDVSWHNDTCPSWRRGKSIVWIDWPDTDDRENPDGFRFVVQGVDEDGCLNDEDFPLTTDNWEAVLAFFAAE